MNDIELAAHCKGISDATRTAAALENCYKSANSLTANPPLPLFWDFNDASVLARDDGNREIVRCRERSRVVTHEERATVFGSSPAESH